MVVVVILGILGATAVPAYQTWRQRSYGSEAYVTMKRLIEAEILYYLDNDKFFPEDGQNLVILPTFPQDHADILSVSNALKITIPVGHNLEYRFYPTEENSDQTCMIQIWAPFPLFKTGERQLIGTVDKKGEVIIFLGG